jgi:hypothetical protein
MSQENGANGSKPNGHSKKVASTDIYWLDEKGFLVENEQEASKIGRAHV